MDFNSDRIFSRKIYPESNEDNENESKDLNFNEIDNDNDNEQIKDEEIQANLIYSWGFSKYGQTGHENTNYVLSPSIINFSQIINSEQFSYNIDIEPVCGESHSALVVQDSEDIYLYMFGKNNFGQLGIEENSYIFEPLLVPSLSQKEKVNKISLGGEHSIILTQRNNIYSCGLNLFGQLGTGDFENRNTFTNINIYENTLKNNENERIIDIAAGAQHNIIISDMNRLYYCGYNRNKFLGINEDINTFTYIDDKSLNNNIILIRASLNVSGVLFEDRETIGIFGQDLDLLPNSTEICLITLKEIEIEHKINEVLEIKDFKLGNEFIEVLLTNGNVYTCGINQKSQLGIDDKIFANAKPIENHFRFFKVSLPEKIIQIETGYDNSIVVSISGKIYGWGSNYYGQICQTKKSSINKPSLISNPFIKDLSLFKISTGAYHTIAIYKGDPSNIPEEEPIFDVFKNKLSSILGITNPDQEKGIEILMNAEQFNNEIAIKQNILNEKIKEIKEKTKNLGIISPNELSTYSRGFVNNFEITFEELEFDEEETEVGKGTFGDVHRGTWRGEDVAVKFLKGSMNDSPESVKQFVDECNILKNLHHPNILLYMGACTIGPQYFVVTEFCENGNLFEYLHIIKDNKLNYDDARRIALEIAYGMNYLHGFRPPILHRDLKSMNVLLDRNTTVKLADFGNTRSFQLQMTKQKGTFQWMAPEVIRGSTYSESSDVFSFGIIMNEIVTRVPPYQGTDKKDVAKKVVNNPNYRPKFDSKKVPRDWADIMVKCWQHDEKKRPTFDEVIDLLTKAKLPGNVFIKAPS